MRDELPGKRRPLFPSEPKAEVDAELAFHLEERIRDYIGRGMDPQAARAAALERLGDLRSVRRDCTQLLMAERRAEVRRDWISDFRQDVKFGLRSALRTPLFTLLAVLTLALGIGANAAVFGVAKSVLLDALPYADARRLVRVYARQNVGTMDRVPLSAGAVTDIAARQLSFSSVGVFMPLKQNLAYAAEDAPLPITGGLAGAGFFSTLGVRPRLGRLSTDDDVSPGAPRVATVSYGAWQRLFGGDPDVIGREIRLNGVAVTVVGVLPRDFIGPMGEVDVWVPLDLSGALAHPFAARQRRWRGLIGRLAPGATPELAASELAALSAELGRAYPDADGLTTMWLASLRDDMVGETRTPLLVLLVSGGLVLLITCANLAGALLSRTISRRKEFAVRAALGAGRGRLVRQLLTESVLLAVLGGAAGLLLATLGLKLVEGLALPALPEYAELALDGGAVLVTFAAALLTGVAFGVAPALSVRRTAAAQQTLRDETRGATESRRSGRLRGALVATQIALCVSLLAGAGLLLRSLWAMTSTPLGFTTDGVLAATVHLPPRYNTTESRVQFQQEFADRLRTLPGVSGVGIVSELPTRVLNRNGFTIDGSPWASPEALPFVLYAEVSDDYFDVLGIPLRSGRPFAPTNRLGSPPVMVISESMARRWWPNGNAVGARIRAGPDPNAPLIEVIGVVGDVRNDPAVAEPEPVMYAPIRQNPWAGQSFVLKTRATPAALRPLIQRELAGVDPAVPVHELNTLRALVDDRFASRRLPVVLMVAFSALALLLASVGVYALFANLALAREREFGVRLTLGSTPRAIAALVFRQGALWMAAGLAGGAIGVIVVSRLLRNLLYGVAPLDPVALGIAAAALLACATIALLVPVRRASRVDPATVLR